MLGGTSFVVCLLVNILFVLFLQFKVYLHQEHLSCCILTWKNIIRTFLLAVRHLLIFLVLILRFLNAKYIHCTLLVCWQSPIRTLLPLCNNFNIKKHKWFVVCYFLFSKYVRSTSFQHFNLKMHQPYLSCISLGCKETKHALYLYLKN